MTVKSTVSINVYTLDLKILSDTGNGSGLHTVRRYLWLRRSNIEQSDVAVGRLRTMVLR
jgi:hypothetical protein